MIGFLAVFLFDTLSLLVQVHLLGKYTYIIYIYRLRKLGRPSWSSLCFSRYIGGGVGANTVIDFVLERGGV